MPPAPPFSIIIPLYNRAAQIGTVIAQLRGRFAGDFEVIIVDDGSRDNSAAAARRALADTGEQGQVIEQANGGPGAARNTGAGAARGTWLVFHDSDDSWYPWTLDIIAATLTNTDPAPALLFFRDVNAPGGGLPDRAEAPLQVQHHAGAFEALGAGSGMAFGSCNLAMRRDVFDTIGGFDTSQRYGEDNDLIYRAAASGPCVLVSAPVMMALSRGLGDHLTDDASAAISGFTRILAQARDNAYPTAPGGDAPRAAEFARIATKLVRRHFETGHLGRGYLAWATHLGILVRGRAWHDALRLPLAPVLALLGARNYQYVRLRKG